MYDELVKRLREHNGWALNETLDEAADAIENMSEAYGKLSRHMDDLVALMPRWIPVTERLPKEMETVLVTDGKNVGWSFCVNDYGTMEFYSAWKITHWMPLPEPPKEG